jgi:hypothetical protein
VPLSSARLTEYSFQLDTTLEHSQLPPISLPLSTTNRKASTQHRTFRNPSLPQWHLLLSLQQLQAVTLALHEQTRAASGK